MIGWVGGGQAAAALPRASAGERERVAARLRDACADDRLSLETFIARLDAAYTARTRAELALLVADLPRPGRLTEAVLGAVSATSRFSQEVAAAWRAPRLPALVLPEQGRSLLGRSRWCDCVIGGEMVSRRHAFLGRGDDRWWLEDCCSRNGTYVNGAASDRCDGGTVRGRDRARRRPLRPRCTCDVGVHPLRAVLRCRLLVEGLRRRERAAPRADRGARSPSEDAPRRRLRHRNPPRPARPVVRGRGRRPRPEDARARPAESPGGAASRRRHGLARPRPALRRRHLPLQLDRLRGHARAGAAGGRGHVVSPRAGRRADCRAVVHARAVERRPPPHARDRRARPEDRAGEPLGAGRPDRRSSTSPTSSARRRASRCSRSSTRRCW